MKRLLQLTTRRFQCLSEELNVQNISFHRLAYHRRWRQFPATLFTFFQQTSMGSWKWLSFNFSCALKILFNFLHKSWRGNNGTTSLKYCKLTTVDTTKSNLVYFSLPSPYSVKTVFDHFLINLFFFSHFR